MLLNTHISLSFVFLSLILSGRPPSRPARHFAGSSSLHSTNRVAARGPPGCHHHIQTTNQAWIKFKKRTTTSGIQPDALQRDYNFILCGWKIKTTNPTSTGTGNQLGGQRKRGQFGRRQQEVASQNLVWWRHNFTFRWTCLQVNLKLSS